MIIKYHHIISFISFLSIAAGVFLPMVSIPFLGEQSFYDNQPTTSYPIVLFALLIFIFSFTKEKFSLWVLALSVSLLLIYSYFKIQEKIIEFEQSMGILTSLLKNIIDTFKASIKIKFGALVLLGGNLMAYFAAAVKHFKTQKN